MTRRLKLGIEFAAFFVAFPVLIYLHVVANAAIPYLLAVAVAAFLVVRRDPAFDTKALLQWNWNEVKPHLIPVLARDAVCLVLLWLVVRLFAPELLFSLVRHSPLLWAAIMVLYPVVSVFPQEFLYRAYFFHRYRELFGQGWGMITASALSFGFVHIIFGNWVAVILCVIGGFLFSFTYRNTGSLLLTCLDHAIFGNFLFTIGLGQYFYHASF